MFLRRAWRWGASDFRKGLAAHDPSKLMMAPILFIAFLAVLDRAIYEAGRRLGMTDERPTRLSALTAPLPPQSERWRPKPMHEA
jgi:hypothetical protein